MRGKSPVLLCLDLQGHTEPHSCFSMACNEIRNLYFAPPLKTLQQANADSQNPMLCEDCYSTISSPELWEVKPRRALIIFQLPLTWLVEIWDGLSGKRWQRFYNRILREGSKVSEWVILRVRVMGSAWHAFRSSQQKHRSLPGKHQERLHNGPLLVRIPALLSGAGDVWNSPLYPIPDTVFPQTLVRLTHILITTCYRDLCNFAIHIYIHTYLYICSIQPRRNHSLHIVTYFFCSNISA